MTRAQERLLIDLAVIVARMAAPDDQRTIDRDLRELQDEALSEVSAEIDAA